MKLLSNPLTFPFFTSEPLASKPFFKPIKASVQAPPPDFDFRNSLASDSRAAIASTFPELLDLADNGTLVLVQKQSFGPTPPWRKEFVEPESIWLVGTSHISQESATHVERVVRTVKPDNVAVELCRSRKVFFLLCSRFEIFVVSDSNTLQSWDYVHFWCLRGRPELKVWRLVIVRNRLSWCCCSEFRLR